MAIKWHFKHKWVYEWAEELSRLSRFLWPSIPTRRVCKKCGKIQIWVASPTDEYVYYGYWATIGDNDGEETENLFTPN